MSIFGDREQLRQPLVVVAALFILGVYCGFWFCSDLFSVDALQLFYLSLASVVLLGLCTFFVSRVELLFLLLFCCGVALSSFSLYRGNDYSRYNYSNSNSYNYINNNKDIYTKSNSWAYGRLELLDLSQEDLGLLSGMLLGRRDGIDSDLRRSYGRSGSAHLLAISGLHLGVIFLMVNTLFSLLNLYWGGHLLRHILSIAVVWGYVCVVGFSPSLVRAASMFSVLQFALFISRPYSSLSGLAAAALAMVVVDVGVLWSVGFQLSVLAVLAILVWALPLWYVVNFELRDFFDRFDKFRVLRFILLSLVIGLACSLATAPLVSYVFGYFTFWGVLCAPLFSVTVALTLLLGLLWIFFGLGFAAPFFRYMVEVVLAIQNSAVTFLSSGWRDAIDVRLSALWVVVLYLVYVVATIMLQAWLERYYAARSVRWYDAYSLPTIGDKNWDDI